MDDFALVGPEDPERTDVARRLAEHHIAGIAEDPGDQIQALLRADGHRHVIGMRADPLELHHLADRLTDRRLALAGSVLHGPLPVRQHQVVQRRSRRRPAEGRRCWAFRRRARPPRGGWPPRTGRGSPTRSSRGCAPRTGRRSCRAGCREGAAAPGRTRPPSRRCTQLAHKDKRASSVAATHLSPVPGVGGLRWLHAQDQPRHLACFVGRRRPVRWSIWLTAGIVFGLVLGFAAGLAKPRVRN